VPVAGALVGGGYTAFYLSSLTESAYHLYRKRFLVMRYGPNVIVPVRKAKTSDKPADDEKPKAAVDGGSLSS